mgnify:CR=1 FL=1
MSNEILDSLLKEYDRKKMKAENDLLLRKENLYNSIPRLQEIEDELNKFAIYTAKSILNGNKESLSELNIKAKQTLDKKLSFDYLKHHLHLKKDKLFSSLIDNSISKSTNFFKTNLF